jgi:hypothetical protein
MIPEPICISDRTMWDEEALISDKLQASKHRWNQLAKTIRGQIRARPENLDLLQLMSDLEKFIPAIVYDDRPYGEVWQSRVSSLKELDDLENRYKELSQHFDPLPECSFEGVVTKAKLIAMMEKAGWVGNISAFLGQASLDDSIKSCKAESGRGWYPDRVLRLGLERGKIRSRREVKHDALMTFPR